MKKRVLIFGTIAVVLLVILVIWFNATIDLMNLDSNEVVEIVVFNGNTGKETRITDETQIENIINNLNVLFGKLSASTFFTLNAAIFRAV